MREGLTLIIALLILGILLDGLRRVRAHRREALRMSRSVGSDGAASADDFDEVLTSSEFPSGGARVASTRDPQELEQVNQSLRKNYAASRLTAGAKTRIPERVSLNLDQPKTEQSVDLRRSEKVMSDTAGEPSLGNLSDLDSEPGAQEYALEKGEPGEFPLAEQDSPKTEKAEKDADVKSETPLSFDFDEEGLGAVRKAQAKPSKKAKAAKEPKNEAAVVPEPEPESKVESMQQAELELEPEITPRQAAAQKSTKKSFWGGAKKQKKPEPVAEESPEAGKMPDEVLIINVMAKRNTLFDGPALLDAMVSQGLKFGDMDIFHRHEQADGQGKILFSVANIVVPGTFEVGAMEAFQTPGISMFLSLPCPGDSIAAFNIMAAAAQAIAAELGGELKDEQRNVMTRQTIEHSRQRVLEYERKKRLSKA